MEKTGKKMLRKKEKVLDKKKKVPQATAENVTDVNANAEKKKKKDV